MITVTVNPSVAMLNIQSGAILNIDETKTVLTDIFVELGNEKPNIMPIKAYIERNKDCTIGISGINDKHAIPMFNHVAVTSIQCEFTSKLKMKQIGFIELSTSHQKALREFHCSNMANNAKEALSYIAAFATLEIGSIGSRITNRDMSYEIHIENLPTDMILNNITPFVKIQNKNKLNRDRTVGYNLTCQNEVEQFMTALGMADEYLNAVIHVEAHQERHGLKNEYDGERLHDKSKAIIYKLKLAA
jgi:hypothetical protein